MTVELEAIDDPCNTGTKQLVTKHKKMQELNSRRLLIGMTLLSIVRSDYQAGC
jgi:hypothetical protein